MPVFDRLPATRIIANPASLDAATWPAATLVLRFASDEVLVIPSLANPGLDDPHAIVLADGGYAGVWLPAADALDFLERTCEWELPQERPAFAQGAVAEIPTKLWLEEERVLFVVPAPYVADFAERLV